MSNLTAGTGTPYWYEWSVGLLYVVKMLNPDNQIKNVGKNRVIFFTNRKMGNQKYTPKGEWQRPPLSKFWKGIKSQVNIIRCR